MFELKEMNYNVGSIWSVEISLSLSPPLFLSPSLSLPTSLSLSYLFSQQDVCEYSPWGRLSLFYRWDICLSYTSTLTPAHLVLPMRYLFQFFQRNICVFCTSIETVCPPCSTSETLCLSFSSGGTSVLLVLQMLQMDLLYKYNSGPFSFTSGTSDLVILVLPVRHQSFLVHQRDVSYSFTVHCTSVLLAQTDTWYKTPGPVERNGNFHTVRHLPLWYVTSGKSTRSCWVASGKRSDHKIV